MKKIFLITILGALLLTVTVLKMLFVISCSNATPKKEAQKEVIQKIFSLAEKIYENQKLPESTKPKDVLDRKEPFHYIWELAENHREVIPKIIRSLEDKDSKTRLKAAISLWAMGRGPMTPDMIQKARRALTKTLKDPDSEVRAYAQKAFKRLIAE